jgi:hypothetical protein
MRGPRRRPARGTSVSGDPDPIAVAKITVPLCRKATDELERVHKLTGISKTDLVNRAIQLYGFVHLETGSGNELLLRRPDQTTHVVHLL